MKKSDVYKTGLDTKPRIQWAGSNLNHPLPMQSLSLSIASLFALAMFENNLHAYTLTFVKELHCI